MLKQDEKRYSSEPPDPRDIVLLFTRIPTYHLDSMILKQGMLKRASKTHTNISNNTYNDITNEQAILYLYVYRYIHTLLLVLLLLLVVVVVVVVVVALRLL